MLGLFVDTLATALPVALIWVILYGGLGALADGRGERALLLAGPVAAAAGIVVGVLRRTTNWIAWEPSLLFLLPVLIGAAVVVLIGTWWPAPTPRIPGWGVGATVALAGLAGFLGASAVVMLAAGIASPGGVMLTSENLLKAGGYLLGLVLAVVTAWVVHRAGASASRTARRLALTAGVAVYTVGQGTVLIRISLARRLIDVSPEVFAVAVWLVNHEWIVTAGLLIAAALPVLRSARPRESEEATATGAQSRILRAQRRSRRRFLTASAVSLGLVALTLTVGRDLAQASPELSPPEPLEADGERVWVSLASLDDGHLHRYVYQAPEGTQVRFFAIRKAPGAFVAVLDACEICGPAGYYERQDLVICKMCDVAMNIATIGFRGGCNPIPIDYEVGGGRLSVTRATLDASAVVFT
ncbi:MAG: DUF2318 domain-containing protein [Propioniciclava sp.]|uniref:Fe-S-containing protein n=1 Tax=Propioniciclava sp. TaxID=2038686 RepID=UPI0039E3D3C9